MESVTVTLSAKSRELAFAICRNRRYAPENLRVASSLLEKLKHGTTSRQTFLDDPKGSGERIPITIYENFPDNTPVELSFQEKQNMSEALQAVKEWSPEDASMLFELQEKLQIKII